MEILLPMVCFLMFGATVFVIAAVMQSSRLSRKEEAERTAAAIRRRMR